MQEAPPNVIVGGGPEGLAYEGRLLRLDTPLGKIKLLRGNHHEHFITADETVEVDGRPLAVFGWSSGPRSRNRGCYRSS